MDIRNLGSFASIEAVWAAYPHGGIEGDYVFIPNDHGTKYRWNKYLLNWENAEIVTETPTREARTVSDLEVQNDLLVGGNARVRGDLEVEGKFFADTYDKKRGKKQSEINDEVEEALADRYTKNEVYSKPETYSKEELNNLITTPEQQFVTYVANTETTAITDILPLSGYPDTIYRVGFWDGNEYNTELYTEYAWDGTQYQLLSVKGGFIYVLLSEYLRNEEVYNFKYAVEDKDGNAICGLDYNDIFRFFVDVIIKNLHVENAEIDNLSGVNIYSGDNLPGYSFAITDKDDNLIIGCTDGGKILLGGVDEKQEKSAVYLRNQDKENYLVAAAGAVSPRVNDYLQLLIVTDTHTNSKSADNWVDAGKDFNSVNALVHLGDVLTPYTPFQANTINKTLKRSKVATYMAIGNHDCGEGSRHIGWALDDEQLYNIFIKPSVDNNFFKEGEYEEGKCYWYHDFERNNVRLIGLYCFDDSNVLDDSKWRPITYDSTYANVAAGTYSAGDRVNVRGYTKHSFECVNNITLRAIPNQLSYNYMQESDDYPGYRALRCITWYSEAQLLWFCDLLVDAATKGYDCIVASHHVFSPNCTLNKGCNFTDYRRSQLIDYNYFSRFTNSNKDIIADIVNAYQNRTSISKRMEAQSGQGPNRDPNNGYAYNYDDASAIPSYDFYYDFSNVDIPVKVTFICGHEHADAVFNHNTYENQTGIMFMSGKIENSRDIRRNTFDSRTFDILTAYTFFPSENKVCLTRMGSDVTNKIDENTNDFVRKSNEIINI